MRMWVFWEEDYRGEGPFSPLRIRLHTISMVVTNAYLDHLAEIVLARSSAVRLPSPSPSSLPPVPFGRKLILKKGIYSLTSLRCSSSANYLEFFCKGHLFLLPQFIQTFIYISVTDSWIFYTLCYQQLFFFFFSLRRLFQL